MTEYTLRKVAFLTHPSQHARNPVIHAAEVMKNILEGDMFVAD